MTRDEAIESLQGIAIAIQLWFGNTYKALSDEILRATEVLGQPQPELKTSFIPCLYCSDADDQANLFEENNYAPYTGMESAVSINKQPDGKHFICADLWGGSNCVADFEIFYCPMCGDDLRKRSNENG